VLGSIFNAYDTIVLTHVACNAESENIVRRSPPLLIEFMPDLLQFTLRIIPQAKAWSRRCGSLPNIWNDLSPKDLVSWNDMVVLSGLA
jgi:hypothetical protein